MSEENAVQESVDPAVSVEIGEETSQAEAAGPVESVQAESAESVPTPSAQETESEAPVNAAEPSAEAPGTVPEAEETPSALPAQETAAVFAEELKCQLDSVKDAVEKQIAALRASFESKLKYDKHKEEIIDRQHKELEGYRAGLVQKVSLQIANDIILLIDDTEKLSAFYEKAEYSEANYKKLLKIYMSFSEELRDILDKHDIFAFRCEPGSPFNAKRQRAMKTTETPDQSLDKTVKESLRWGFENEGKMIRNEMVNVYVYKEEKAVPPEEGKPQETES